MKKIVTTLLAALSLSTAFAWPDKPVTMVVPFPPGGSTDLIARTLGPKLQERLGGTFITDNKAGATGTIGAGIVTRAPADGHTLFVSSSESAKPNSLRRDRNAARPECFPSTIPSFFSRPMVEASTISYLF